MTEWFDLERSGMIYALCAVLYVVFIHILDKIENRHSQNKPLSDEESLTQISQKMNCSEYEVFKVATGDWSLPASRVDADFKDYLTKGILPYYVRSFIRKHKSLLNYGRSGRNSAVFLVGVM